MLLLFPFSIFFIIHILHFPSLCFHFLLSSVFISLSFLHSVITLSLPSLRLCNYVCFIIFLVLFLHFLFSFSFNIFSFLLFLHYPSLHHQFAFRRPILYFCPYSFFLFYPSLVSLHSLSSSFHLLFLPLFNIPSLPVLFFPLSFISLLFLFPLFS